MLKLRWDAWHQFVAACTEENILQFLSEVSESDWLTHANDYNLHAELEFIERNGLDSMLAADRFSWPLSELESSEIYGWIPLVEAYKGLCRIEMPVGFQLKSAEKLVHIRCRQVVRKTLDMEPLTQQEIDAFLAKTMPIGPDYTLSPYNPTDDMNAVFSQEQLKAVADYIKKNIPSVADFIRSKVHLAEKQGYVGERDLGGTSNVWKIVDQTTAYFLSPHFWIYRDAIVQTIAEG
jgi:hypothetical protein